MSWRNDRFRAYRRYGRSIYFPSFQISVASFQSFPIFSQTTTYLPVTSLGSGPLVFRLYIPISRAAEGPSGLTSSVVSFGSLTCSAVLFHIDPIASRPRTIAAPGGSAVASSAYNDAIPAKSPLLKNSIHLAFNASISDFCAEADPIKASRDTITSAILLMISILFSIAAFADRKLAVRPAWVSPLYCIRTSVWQLSA